jgi:hypothetical protein
MLFPNMLSPPNIVAGILIPGSTEELTFRAISRLERPPIHRYVLARDLFLAVLRGRSLDWALNQAESSRLSDQRMHAITLLRACGPFLESHQGTLISETPRVFWEASELLKLPNLHGAVVQVESHRSLALFHFWRSELRADRMSLIKTAVQSALWRSPGLAGIEISIITAPFNDVLKRRCYRRISCDSGCAEPEELEQFGSRLSDVWSRYHEQHPTRSWP